MILDYGLDLVYSQPCRVLRTVIGLSYILNGNNEYLEVKMKNNKRGTIIGTKKDKEHLRRAIKDSALKKAVVESQQDFWDKN